MKKIYKVLFVLMYLIVFQGCFVTRAQKELGRANEKIEIYQGYVNVQIKMIDGIINEYDTVVTSVQIIQNAIYNDTNVWNKIDKDTQKILSDAWKLAVKYDKGVQKYIVKYTIIKGQILNGQAKVDEVQEVINKITKTKINYSSIAIKVGEVLTKIAIKKLVYNNTELNQALAYVQTLKVIKVNTN